MLPRVRERGQEMSYLSGWMPQGPRLIAGSSSEFNRIQRCGAAQDRRGRRALLPKYRHQHRRTQLGVYIKSEEGKCAGG